MRERLQKILARAGYGSRRACEELIAQGRVTVNGKVARLGDKADPYKDEIRVDGERVRKLERPLYIALYKPRGVLSDAEKGRKSVLDLVPIEGRVYPVGRLDVTSEGLMLLTNDGDLAHRLTHPRYGHEKEYHVLVEGHPSEKTLEKWRRGVYLEGRRTRPATVEVMKQEKDTTWLRVVMREGRKRQIRRIAAMLGHPVRRLIRVRIGPLELGTMKPGQWRHLRPREVRALRQIARGR